MPLSHEHIGSKILTRIKIYILTRAELLFNLCYEIPCSFQSSAHLMHQNFRPSFSPYSFLHMPFPQSGISSNFVLLLTAAFNSLLWATLTWANTVDLFRPWKLQTEQTNRSLSVLNLRKGQGKLLKATDTKTVIEDRD